MSGCEDAKMQPNMQTKGNEAICQQASLLHRNFSKALCIFALRCEESQEKSRRDGKG